MDDVDVKELSKQLLEIQSGAAQKRAEIDKEATEKKAEVDEEALQQTLQVLDNFAKKQAAEHQLSLALTGYII